MKLPIHSFRTFWAYHAWAGLVVSLVLHVMCIAGAVTLFLAPLKIWEEPAQHRPASETTSASPQVLFDRGLAAIQHLPSPPKRLWLGLPIGDTGVARFQYSGPDGKWRAVWLPPGDAAAVPEREQAAVFVYHLHYLWHPALPELEYLAGFVALTFLLTLVTGLLIHLKDLARQLTQFRPRAGRRTLWSDMHKVCGVMGLPFQLIYSYTGALLVFGPVLLTAIAGPVFGDDRAREAHIAWNEPAGLRPPGGPAVPRSLDEIQDIAKAAVPGFRPLAFGVQGHAREHGLVRAFGQIDGAGDMANATVLIDQTTGAVLHVDAPATDLASHATRRWLSGLHYAYYGGNAVRILLAVLALAASATILTGNWIWLARRRARSPGRRAHLLARLTAGFGAGIFVAIGCLFVASRLLPLDAPSRIASEQQIFFAALAGCIAWALVARSADATWWKQLGLAGALLASVPLFAARISSAGLFGAGPRIASVAGVDLGFLCCGAVLLAVALGLRRLLRRQAGAPPATEASPDPLDPLRPVGESAP